MARLVSVIVLNWNGKSHLEKCLVSLSKVIYKPIEIIVVDNASSDGSVEMVYNLFPEVRIIRNKVNEGYCRGNNIGIKQSKGDYIFILNNDTEVPKNFLKPLVTLLEKDISIGLVQPKLVYGENHNKLNAVGSYFTSTGILYHYGYRKPADRSQYNQKLYIYSAKGAAMLVRKKALDKVGLFDEDFFIFFEETDLCHRLWLAGYKVIYEPQSVIYHFEAVDTDKQMVSYTRNFLSLRNRICSYIKNLETINCIQIFLILSPIYIALFFYYLLKLEFVLAYSVLTSIGWNFIQFPKTLAKRKKIQNLRKRKDQDFFSLIKIDPPIEYYYYFFTYNLKKFTNEKPLKQNFHFDLTK